MPKVTKESDTLRIITKSVLPITKTGEKLQTNLPSVNSSQDNLIKNSNTSNISTEKTRGPMSVGLAAQTFERGTLKGALQAPEDKHHLDQLKHLQNQFGRFNRPLLLIADASDNAPPKSFERADELFARLSREPDRANKIRARNVFIFDRNSFQALRQIDSKSLVAQKKDQYFCILFGIHPSNSSNEDFAKQVALAAIIATGGLGFKDEELAKTILSGVPSMHKQYALDEALFILSKEPGLASATILLKWGASANALNSDDDMSILFTAMLSQNVDLIRLLMLNGANATDDLGSQISAEELTEHEKFRHLAPLLNLSPKT